MSDDRSASESLGGISATARVVRGGNREVTVSVDLVCLHPDGQFKYELRAEAKVVIPAGDPLPVFVPNGRPSAIFSAYHAPASAMTHADFEAAIRRQLPQPVVGTNVPSKFSITAHTVCHDPEGNVKWEADTEPITLAPDEPMPDSLVGCNTVVTATPRPYGGANLSGH